MSAAPVLIEQHGGAYHVTRGKETLLVVPHALFDSYTQDTVFPPTWADNSGDTHPVRRLYWNPRNRQFLMAGLERHPARVVEGHGTTGYRSFLQGFWLPKPPVLLLRPLWNPSDPYQPFDVRARNASLDVQLTFYQLLKQLRPPAGWTTILNATDSFLETLGLTAESGNTDPETVHELSLLPALELTRPPAVRLLHTLSQQHLKGVFPVLRDGALSGLHTLGVTALRGAETLLAESGIGYQPGAPG